MAFPRFYDPRRVGQLVTPDVAGAIAEGHARQALPADADKKRILLMLVDVQVDFVHTDGALSVPGAVDDTRRTIEWIFNHLDSITTIAASLDSHIPNQIFYPTWWRAADGQPPAPYTAISAADVASGKWQPVYEREWSIDYVHKLEAQAKKVLMIWPYHTMIGTPGHAITPALYEAIAFHAAARRTQPEFLVKGTIPKTEHYSMLEPEVKVPEHPLGTLNTRFLEMVASYDTIYVAGQAKSHCVLETVTSMMRHFEKRPDIINKMNILMDCTSSVKHPTIDFETLANEIFAGFTARGLNHTLSIEPLR